MAKKNAERKQKYKSFGTMYYVSAIGLQFPIAIVLGFLFGRWLDRMFGTWPYLTGLFSFFGIAAGFVNLFKMTADASRAEAEQQRMEEQAALRDEADEQ